MLNSIITGTPRSPQDMTVFSRIIFLTLVVSSLLATPTLSSGTPLLTYCSSDGNYSAPSTYASNLHDLLAILTLTTPKTENLFLVQTVGVPNTPQAFGLAQCRPDSSSFVCADCLTQAAISISNFSCPVQKSASIRYDYCVLRYADYYFPSVLEYPSFVLTTQPKNASNSSEFRQQVGGMLVGLLLETKRSSLRIAAGVVTVEGKRGYYKIYGLAWCTNDLESATCYQCLDHVLKNLEGCCGYKIGGQSMTTSCIVSYNNFSFFDDSLIQLVDRPPPSPPQVGTETGKRRGSQTKKIIIGVSISASIVSAVIVVFILLICRKRLTFQKTSKLDVEEDIRTIESHILPLVRLKAATNDFSNENKLGEGRFGPVYKGVLWDGRQVVVKRLSKIYGQGLVELRNEAALVAQLQHKNLVKLLGYCLKEEEKLLVYEYLPNASLEKHLYDPAWRAQLDWKKRHMIIEGIARGLVYLHNHSRIRIIHRDLNANNILLDGDMNPKISDFGIAKLVGINESQWNTKQIAGTFGYMAPEYATRGLFSTKSDVFSYGMVVLEIITGRRNGSFIEMGNALNLQTYVWQHWNQGKSEKIIDQGLGGKFQVEDVLRSINIGLLCIQADPVERPSMASVVLMLSTNTEMIPAPSIPGYFTGENPTSVSSESPTSLGGTNENIHSVDNLTTSARSDSMQAR